MADLRIIVDPVWDLEYGAPGSYRWLACHDCGLVRLDPFPDSEALGRAYPDHYHTFASSTSRITRVLRRLTIRITAALASRSIDWRGRVLDIGCSRGELLAAMSRIGEHELWGVETHGPSVDIARSSGIHVWAGYFEQAKIPEGSVKLIMMQHVLEHVYDPVGVLRKCSAILEPGGALRGELPNIDSWDFHIFRELWGGGHVPRHLWHFTPATLRRALDLAGFGEIKIRPNLHTGHWALSLQHAIRRGRWDPSGLRQGRAWYFPFLLVMCLPVNLVQALCGKTGVMSFSARWMP